MQHSAATTITHNKNMESSNQSRCKKTKGRQKIEIKPIQNKSQQQVTFSKRRNGLINKATELSLLCGAKVAIVGFSPGGKPFSFGHPDVNTVLDGYVGDTMLAEGPQQATQYLQLQELKMEYQNSLRKLEEEKKQSATIEELNKMGEENHKLWWDESVDNMGLEELEDYVSAMEELKKNVFNRVSELTIMSQATHHLTFCDINRLPGPE